MRRRNKDSKQVQRRNEDTITANKTWKMWFQISIGHVLVDKSSVDSLVAISNKARQISMVNRQKKLNLNQSQI